MSDTVEIVREDVLYEGYNRLVRLHYRFRRHDDSWTEVLDREVLDRHDATGILLYDPERDCIVFIEQLRAGALYAGKQAIHLEVVAGMLMPGQRPEDSARQEALEEAGCPVTDIIPIGDFMVCPSCVTETIHCFVALVDSSQLGGVHGCIDEGEETRVRIVPIAEAEVMLAEGKMGYLLTVFMVQWLLLNRHRLVAGARSAPA